MVPEGGNAVIPGAPPELGPEAAGPARDAWFTTTFATAPEFRVPGGPYPYDEGS